MYTTMTAQKPMANNNYQEIQGFWAYAEKIAAPGTVGNHPSSVINFRCEGETLTIRLVSLSPMMDAPGDGFYKLKTKWEGNTLCYLTPHGRWEEFAIYGASEFIMHVTDEKHRYVKVDRSEVKDWNKDLLKDDREVHAYE